MTLIGPSSFSDIIFLPSGVFFCYHKKKNSLTYCRSTNGRHYLKLFQVKKNLNLYETLMLK